MHFAAWLNVSDSVRDPVGYYRNNVLGTLATLEAMAAESCRRFVFSSTCAVYGEPVETPIRETHPTAPINAYGQTKLAIEHALPHYERAWGLRSIRLRYFNAAGADPDGELGEDHDPEIHVIPRAFEAATGGAEFQILGTDYPTPDGTCLRDYIHVTDLAGATCSRSAISSRAARRRCHRPRHRASDVRARDDRGGGAGDRASGRPAGGAAAPRRPGRTLRVGRHGPGRTSGWVPAPPRHRHDRRRRLAMVHERCGSIARRGRPLMSRLRGALHDPLLSVVMPVFNELDTIEEIIRRVLALPVRVAAGGGRRLFYRRHPRPAGERSRPELGFVLLQQPRNQGKGAALRRGFEAVTGDLVVIQDADLEVLAEELPQLIELICDGRADVVYGSRFLGRTASSCFTHYLGNRLLTLLTNVLYNTMLTDMETCYKVMRADVLRSMTLESNGFGSSPSSRRRSSAASCASTRCRSPTTGAATTRARRSAGATAS